jgi:hypothetical protein
MKVGLINPPSAYQTDPSFSEPVYGNGLLYVEAALRKAGHEVRIKYDVSNLQGRGYCHQARNQAMQALEQELMIPNPHEIPYIEDLQKKAREALSVCMNCEYRKPEIAEIFASSKGGAI